MSQPLRARILVADDEESIRFVMREALEACDHEVVCVADGDAARAELAAAHFDLAFLDLRMPGPGGLELLASLRSLAADTAVVIITAQNTFQNAVDAMKGGALDYLVKPFPIAAVQALADKALRIRALEREVRALRRERGPDAVGSGERLIGSSPAMLEIFKTVGRVAPSNVAVLISGESGTGKELLAHAIHAASPRAEAPFVAVNAVAIPRELLESELFGHERGAFTGAVESRLGRFREASGGTLFLDEIGDMPVELQAKLLRVLQSGEVTSLGGRRVDRVDVRIIAATHRDLDTAVREGSFREDLLYRLRVVPIDVPPLRQRADDVRRLALYFTRRYARELATGPRFLADSSLEILAAYSWPGNVRELENAIKRALVLSSGEVLEPDDFAFVSSAADPTNAADASADALEDRVRAIVRQALTRPEAGQLFRRVLARAERPLLEEVLAHTEGNQLRAAALLGINRNTLRKKLAELGVTNPSRKQSG